MSQAPGNDVLPEFLEERAQQGIERPDVSQTEWFVDMCRELERLGLEPFPDDENKVRHAKRTEHSGAGETCIIDLKTTRSSDEVWRPQQVCIAWLSASNAPALSVASQFIDAADLDVPPGLVFDRSESQLARMRVVVDWLKAQAASRVTIGPNQPI